MPCSGKTQQPLSMFPCLDQTGTSNASVVTFTAAAVGNFDGTIAFDGAAPAMIPGDPRWSYETVVLDKTALSAEIETATALLGEDPATEGTPGAALKAAITEAQTALAKAATQAAIDAAVQALKDAEAAYQTPTGINGASLNDNVEMINDNDTPAYNLAGQKVGKGYKGIVIKKGKKVVMK